MASDSAETVRQLKGKLPWRVGTKVSQLPQPSMCTIYDADNQFVAVAETAALAEQVVFAVNAAGEPGDEAEQPK